MQRDEANLYLRNVEEQYQRTRELWHDLKNHISLLSLLLQEEKYGEMADYLRIFGDDVDSLTLPVKSGNLVVDALLADKVAKAKKEDIQVELSLCNLTGLSLKPDEICSLLGNLLDNALEANRQVPEGKFLSVECRERMDFYYIKVQNAAAGNRSADMKVMQVQGADKLRAQSADKLPSPKTDRRNQVGHGLGLRSMERIVHACGGELAVERTESQFTAVVRLPRIPVSYI
ncbi:MAG: sensor histidine kinase [Lachnospiraceae bacterium]|nr:GHKL domain-containing protein [uncultured Acetatifactor sp.]MCI8543157.1 sensor histidine kinase [Lachnospiraceae bacterium]